MLRAAAAASLTLSLLAGCSGDEDEPRPITGPARQVAEAIEELERATARRDFRKVCAELFTPEVRRQAGGRECATLLARTAADVRRPQIDVERIEIEGDRAIASVVTRAAGQRAARDRIELVRRGGRYRIAALAG